MRLNSGFNCPDITVIIDENNVEMNEINPAFVMD